MQADAVIVAAGSSVRFGAERPKQFSMLAGRPLLAWTISRFEAARSIRSIGLVVPSDWLKWVGEEVVAKYGCSKVGAIVAGGETRGESVLIGLEALPPATQTVAIHDGARPLVLPADIDAVVEVAIRTGAAMLAAPVADTIKETAEGAVVRTIDRTRLFAAQTPQVFSYELILDAHRSTAGEHRQPDDASLLEELHPVRLVIPSGPNPKVTTAADFGLIEAYLAAHGNR